VRIPTRRRAIQLQSHIKPLVYLTLAGKAGLQAELEDLLSVQRPAIAASILAAREDGDLKENGAYHDAKDRQGLMEGRIRELRTKLEHVEIIETPTATGVVTLGSTVTLASAERAVERYTIVGSMESNVAAGRISNESPLGRVLLGCKAGDEASVTTPLGETQYNIIAVS
jgi:transcription elongation factor GreA